MVVEITTCVKMDVREPEVRARMSTFSWGSEYIIRDKKEEVSVVSSFRKRKEEGGGILFSII